MAPQAVFADPHARLLMVSTVLTEIVMTDVRRIMRNTVHPLNGDKHPLIGDVTIRIMVLPVHRAGVLTVAVKGM